MEHYKKVKKLKQVLCGEEPKKRVLVLGHFFLTPMFRRSSASAARWILAAQCPRVRPPEARSLLHAGVRRGDFWLSEASFISSPSPYDGRDSGTNHSLLIFVHCVLLLMQQVRMEANHHHPHSCPRTPLQLRLWITSGRISLLGQR
jgi:hypothetical protein